MLVSAVVDPSAFNKDCFDDLYTIHVEDFLEGIWRNGLLILDSGKKLKDELLEKAKSLSDKEKRLQVLLTEILKEKSKCISVHHPVSQSNGPSVNLLDLTCSLKAYTEADALILGDKNFETVRFDKSRNIGIVQLSKYRDSDFEKLRQRYYDGLESIDKLDKTEVEEIITRSIRYSKRLRFYDKYIAIGENTSGFLDGIKYILSLWRENGLFISKQGIGEVEIYTCTEHVRESETDYAKESKLTRSQENCTRINQDLKEWVREEGYQWWQIKVFVKDDPDGIFHARYLESQHAIIRIDRGFDLFKGKNRFWRNFFTLNMAESSHLKECRELPESNVSISA